MSGFEIYPEVWGVDSEWGFRDGLTDHESAFEPVVFCAVARRTGDRLVFWRHDKRLHAFVAEHPHDLYVAHNATAEMKYLLRVGMPLPTNWYDTMIQERNRTNQPNPPRVSLSVSLHRYGLPHMAPQAKAELQQRILHLQFDADDPEELHEIEDYCQSDCDGCLALFEAQTESA